MSSVSGVGSLQSINASQHNAATKAESIKSRLEGQDSLGSDGPSFSERLQSSLDSVANAQNQAAQSVIDYETGRNENLTKVMVDQQVSSLGFQMTLNVRNKALSAYKEIMNMPV